MTAVHYLLQVNLYLVLFFVFYKLLLEKETYFMLNRFYLIISGILSLAIPFLRPEWFVKQSANYQISVDKLNIIAARISETPVTAGQFNWAKLVVIIYATVTVLLLARFVIRLFAVQKSVKSDTSGKAFSFFQQKVIDHTLPLLEVIDKHEEIHIRQLHSLDVLLFEVLSILVWFNPVIYYYKTAVKHIHEFLADEQAASFQGDKEAYALLLLSKALGIHQDALTNTFYNKSLVKKRIFMLHKQRSKKIAILKYGLFLPLFAVTLLCSSASIKKNEDIKDFAEKISYPAVSTLTDPKSEKPEIAAATEATPAQKVRVPAPDSSFKALNEVAQSRSQPAENNVPAATSQKVYDFVELTIPPNFPGGMYKFYEFIGKSVKYPEEAAKNNIEGKVYLSFVVEISGELTNVKVVRSLNAQMDEEALRVLRNSPKWSPGYTGDQPVRVKYNIPISFGLDNGTVKNTASPKPMVTAPAVAKEL